MLGALAIATGLLAIFDDNEDLEELFQRAILLKKPSLFLERYEKTEIAGLFDGLIQEIKQSSSLESLRDTLKTWYFLYPGLGVGEIPHPYQLSIPSEYALHKDFPVFGEAPYGMGKDKELWLSLPDDKGVRRRLTRKEVKQVEDDELEGEKFVVVSWDATRILISLPSTAPIDRGVMEIQPITLLIAPEGVSDGVLWADLEPNEQITLAKFISQDLTEKEIVAYEKKFGTYKTTSGAPRGFRWSDVQDGVLLPPGLDERQRVVLVNGDSGSSHLDILGDLVPKEDRQGYRFYRSGDEKLYWFQFGSGYTNPDQILVWAHSFDTALEEAAGWVKDNMPGLFTEPNYEETAEEHGVPWPADEASEDYDEEVYQTIHEEAEADLTYTESGYISSDEWTGGDVHDAMVTRWVVLQSDEALDMALSGDWSSR